MNENVTTIGDCTLIQTDDIDFRSPVNIDKSIQVVVLRYCNNIVAKLISYTY